MFILVRVKPGFDFRGKVRHWSGCSTEGHLSDHRFRVGQSVNYTSGLRRQPGWGGAYKITQLLPAQGDELLYRIKSVDEPHERVAKENELERLT
jgi:hypothetical protein